MPQDFYVLAVDGCNRKLGSRIEVVGFYLDVYLDGDSIERMSKLCSCSSNRFCRGTLSHFCSLSVPAQLLSYYPQCAPGQSVWHVHTGLPIRAIAPRGRSKQCPFALTRKVLQPGKDPAVRGKSHR